MEDVAGLKPRELARIRGRLVDFASEVFEPMPRKDQRRWGEVYVRGLMLDGRRKSIEPMAARLEDGDEQCLQQFVNQSPWDWGAVRERLARRMSEELEPAAWIVDDTGFPKFGRHSVGVARQYCGALGKVSNCQLGVSISAATEEASCPLDWRLFLPEEWDSDEERRRKAGVAEEVRHEPKWRLALRMLDELRGWGLESPPILADAAYGDITEFRSGLDERELRYVLQVKGQTSAYAEGVRPATPDYRGTGRPPRPRYREKPSSLRELALAEGAEQAVEVSWREGSDGEPLSSRFLLLRVRPANVKLRRQAKDSELPVRWLICEWPQGQAEPAKYWLSNLPEDAEPERLVALAKAPLADRARLPRAQGLPRARPLRGALLPGLAPPRDARLGGARLPHARAAQPKSPCGDLTLFRVLRELQQLVACWSGTCPTCKRRLPRKTAYLKASPVPT